jgi:hypothetical protein
MFRATLILSISALPGAPSAAQQVISARAGLIYYAEGAVNFDGVPARVREGERYPTLTNGQLISSDLGHAEIQLGAGATLWTGYNSKIRLVESSLDNIRLRTEAGSGMIEVRNIPDGNRIRVETGSSQAELVKPGLYRFDADPATVRVYDGECIVGGVRVRPGQEALVSAVPAAAGPFDRGRPGELLYWAAWRSFRLAEEVRFREGSWSVTGLYGETRRHSAFGIQFPVAPGAARVQYLTASAPGLVYFLDGQALLAGRDPPREARVPFRVGSENTIGVEPGGFAEIFLGVGVVARLGPRAEMRFLDAAPLDSTVSLSKGKAIFEVSRAAGDTRIRVAVGETVSELERPGLYEFDAGAELLRVWGGQVSVAVGQRKFTVRRNQRITLVKAPKSSALDRGNKDALYEWTRERSLALAGSSALFMTQWERVGAVLRHPQFGSIGVPRGRGRAAGAR